MDKDVNNRLLREAERRLQSARALMRSARERVDRSKRLLRDLREGLTALYQGPDQLPDGRLAGPSAWSGEGQTRPDGG
jgi:hypothetical protein